MQFACLLAALALIVLPLGLGPGRAEGADDYQLVAALDDYFDAEVLRVPVGMKVECLRFQIIQCQ